MLTSCSHKGWSDCAGMAWVNSMCGGNANSVNQVMCLLIKLSFYIILKSGTFIFFLIFVNIKWDYESISGPTVVLGHEFGHNMGFNHDSGKKITQI